MSDDANSNPFDGPQLENTHYKRANMVGSYFDGVNLDKARFFAVMTGAKFMDTNLAGADFNDVNLSDSNFFNINLSKTTISNANLSQVKISGVTLENAEISDANMSGMRINGVLVTDLFEAYDKANG